MKLRKMLGALVMGALLACTLGAVAGCSNSEQVIREGTIEMFDHYKNIDETVIAELDETLGEDAEMLGLSAEEVAQATLEGFDYTIDSVDVDGSNAEVVVTITSKDLSNLKEDMAAVQDEMWEKGSETEGMGTDEGLQWYGQKLKEYLNDASIKTREPMTLSYVLNGNTWEMTAASRNLMNSFITS